MNEAADRAELPREAPSAGAATSVAVFPFRFDVVPRQIAMGWLGASYYFGAFIVSNSRSITFSTLTPSASAR